MKDNRIFVDTNIFIYALMEEKLQVDKYSRKNDVVKNSGMKKKSSARTAITFLSKTEKLTFDLPKDYRFDRDSSHDR